MDQTPLLEQARISLAGLRDFANDITSPNIRLGVTGLSRAGKTVFITALIHALTHKGRLPLLSAYREGRLLSVRLAPGPDPAIPRFAYEQHVEALTGDNRHWPESTHKLSQIRLALEISKRGFLGGAKSPSILYLDIIDYPGEWLLDLPLLSQTYAQWVAGLKSRFANMPIADGALEASDLEADKAHQIFREFGKGLPGRFLMPGDLEGSGLLTFAPCENEGPLHHLMRERYQAYLEKIVRPFWRDHLARLDRQIVLTDVLSALNDGPKALETLQNDLTNLLAAFRQGAQNWASRILGRRIDRILFAATKADRLHHTSHDRLEAILAKLIEQAAEAARMRGADIGITALAAIRATREARVREGSEELSCIIGTPEQGETLDNTVFDGKTEAALFTGDLPVNPDHAFDGSLIGAVSFPRLRPPLSPTMDAGLAHIRLDKALEFLIGDRLT